MGYLYYGEAAEPIRIEDRMLAHLKVVLATKLRRNESFTLSWQHREGEQAGRSTLWLHPSISLRFVFDDAEEIVLSQNWLAELSMSASSSGGIRLTDEQLEAADDAMV